MIVFIIEIRTPVRYEEDPAFTGQTFASINDAWHAIMALGEPNRPPRRIIGRGAEGTVAFAFDRQESDPDDSDAYLCRDCEMTFQPEETMDGTACPACGTYGPQDDRCPDCDTLIPAGPNVPCCPDCGEPLDDNDGRIGVATADRLSQEWERKFA